jgi:hypothetical protein
MRAHWDEAWLLQQITKPGYRLVDQPGAPSQAIPVPCLTPIPPPAPTVPPSPYRSQTEARYAALLQTRQAGGEIAQWWFEGLKLRLAHNTFYTADFLVQVRESPLLQLHEVKGGFWRDDARVKIKVAAQQYPCFVFLAVQYINGTWKYETFSHK